MKGVDRCDAQRRTSNGRGDNRCRRTRKRNEDKGTFKAYQVARKGFNKLVRNVDAGNGKRWVRDDAGSRGGCGDGAGSRGGCGDDADSRGGCRVGDGVSSGGGGGRHGKQRRIWETMW